jgi:hypothetical protein
MNGFPVMPQDGTASTFVKMSSLATAVNLTSIPANVKYAVVQCETADVRWRADGTAPTVTDGMLLPAGGERTFDSGSIAAVKFIQVSAAATLQVSYFV